VPVLRHRVRLQGRAAEGASLKILVVAPNWIGDTLLAQPLLARLRERAPDATIHVLAPPWTAPVARRMPEVDAVIEAPFGHGELRLTERWKLARTLRASGYGRAYVLPNSFKSALIPWLARIPERIGFLGESRHVVLSERHRLDEAALPLMADRYAKLAEAVDAMPARPLPTTSIRVDTGNRTRALAALGLDASRPMIAFCPGAEYGPAKRWPAHHFAALANVLVRNGQQVWLFGGPGDQEITGAIHRAAGWRTVDLAGRTDLASAIDLLSLATAVVTNDSGLMHIASALQRPMVAIYGSSSPQHTPPLGRAHIEWLNLDCSPCFERICPLGHLRCLEDVSPERIHDAIARVAKVHERP